MGLLALLSPAVVFVALFACSSKALVPLICPSSPPAANSQSLEVNYIDLANTMPTIAIWVADHPKEVLPILHETAKEVSVRSCAFLRLHCKWWE